MTGAQEKSWSPEEEALHVAYELSPDLRRTFRTFDSAMSDPAAAAALRAFAHAWRKNHPATQEDGSHGMD